MADSGILFPLILGVTMQQAQKDPWIKKLPLASLYMSRFMS